MQISVERLLTRQGGAMVANCQAQCPKVPGQGQVNIGAGVNQRACHEVADNQAHERDDLAHPPVLQGSGDELARGAVGCGASRIRSTAGVGVDSTAETAENVDSVTIRYAPWGWARSFSRTFGSGLATATGIPDQSRTWPPAVARTSTATVSEPSSTPDRSQTTPRGPSARASCIAWSRSSPTSLS